MWSTSLTDHSFFEIDEGWNFYVGLVDEVVVRCINIWLLAANSAKFYLSYVKQIFYVFATLFFNVCVAVVTCREEELRILVSSCSLDCSFLGCAILVSGFCLLVFNQTLCVFVPNQRLCA